MANFLKFLSENSSGVLILILIGFSLLIAINWLARIFRWGRYNIVQLEEVSQGGFGYVMTQFFVNLINDFKHLLALIIVIIFASLIVYSMTTTENFEEKMEALQLVIASLGGILGTIIGYYFGESAAKGRVYISTTSDSTQSGEIDDFNEEDNPIIPAPELNQ